MSPESIAQIADKLRSAGETRTPVPPLTEQFPDLTEDDAYKVQWANAAARLKHGHRVVGFKIGLTSREAQKHFQVFKPDFGHLFEDMAVADGGEILLDDLIQPKVEGEIAFVLGRDLQGPGLTIVDALCAVDFVCAALEIIDSRIRDWKIRAPDTIADNGSSARFVLGSRRVPFFDLDLATIGMNLSCHNEVMITAAGAAVMGNPLNALVFLANELATHSLGLRAGQVVLSGSLGGMLNVNRNEYFSADFLRLGRVAVGFR